jgi:hypothetical protein
MASIAIQNIAAAGTTPSYTACNASDTVPAAPRTERLFLHYKGGASTSATLTITPVQPTSYKVPDVGNVAVPNISVALGANADKMVPVPPAYIDATGNVTLAHTGTLTGLTVAPIVLPAASV